MSIALANASSFQNGPGAANGADSLAAFAQSLGGAANQASAVSTFKQCIAEAMLASAKQSNNDSAAEGAQPGTSAMPKSGANGADGDGLGEAKPFIPIFHGAKIHAPKTKSDAQSDGDQSGAAKLISDAARGAGDAPGLSLLQAIAAQNGMRVESAPLQTAPLAAENSTETLAATASALGRAASAAVERNALNQTAVANHAAARSAAAIAATSEEVSPLFLKLSDAGDAAQNGSGANAASGSGARVWQLQELGVQLGNALKSVLGQKAARTTPGQSAGLRGSLERMANLPGMEGRAGMQNRAGMAGDGNAESANGRSAGQNSQGGGAQFGAEKAAAKFFAAGAADHAAAKEIPAADAGANATSSNQSVAAPLGEDATWTAQPVRAGEHFIRQPRLLEQVRQAADFIAQRAEGAVKLGEGHVEAQLRLYPPTLGEIRVNLTMNGDGTAAAKFVAARPEAAALLNNHMQEFRDSVARHGLSLDQVQVSVAARAVGASGSAQNSQWQNSQWHGGQNQNGNAREDGANPGDAQRERAEGGAGNQGNGGDARQSRREQDARRQAWQRPAYQ